MLVAVRKAERGLILGLILVIIAMNLWALEEYPTLHCDEAVLSNIGYRLVDDGMPTLSIMGGLGGYDRLALRPSLFYQLGLGVFLHLFSNTPLTARAFSVVGWLVSAWLVFLIGRRLYNRQVGMLSALMFSISLNVWWASHQAREEIWTIAAGMAVLAIYLKLRGKPSRGGFFVLGLLAALVLDVHPNTIWLSMPVAILAIIDNYRATAGCQYIILAALGMVVGLVGLVVIHLLPDPRLALEQIRLIATLNELSPTSQTDTLSQLDYLVWFLNYSYIQYFSGAVSLFTICTAAGIGYAAYQRDKSDRLLLGLWALSAISFLILMPHKPPYYRPLWAGFAALFIGAAAVRIGVWIAKRRRWLSAGWAAFLLCAPLITANLLAQAWLSAKFKPRDYSYYATSVVSEVPEGVSVLGPSILWPYFEERNPFVAGLYFYYAEPFFDYSMTSFAETLDTLEVEYVIFDGVFDCGYSPTPESGILGEYLGERCTLTARIDYPWFGADGGSIQGHPTLIYDCTKR